VIIKVIEILTLLRIGFQIQEHMNEELVNNNYVVCILYITPFYITGRKVDLALRMFSNSREGRKWQIQISNVNK